MKKPGTTIAIATIYLIIFQVVAQTDSSASIIFSMLSFAPFVILYMTYVILKYSKPSEHTFEERFYDDWDYKRNYVEKEDQFL
jgi:ABC-type transport system involved in cytochrome bd biosynthesis fused ATPase/permease subunit